MKILPALLITIIVGLGAFVTSSGLLNVFISELAESGIDGKIYTINSPLPVVVNLNNIIVGLGEVTDRSLLNISVSMHVGEADEARVTVYSDSVREVFIRFLSALDREIIGSPDFILALSKQLKHRANFVLGERTVRGLFITELRIN